MSLVKRHIIKTISWRIIGSLDTFLLSWLFSGRLYFGLLISGSEIITKSILYYLHERIWFKSRFYNPNKRHLYKTFTWRAVGTIDTFFLALIITGSSLTGFKIGGFEILSKMALYYIHEKVWYGFNFGLDHRKSEKKSKTIINNYNTNKNNSQNFEINNSD